MKIQATFNGKVIAESENTKPLEGNHYFPKESIKSEYFKNSNLNTTCPWKGLASYYSVEIDGELNEDAAWYYPEPKAAAAAIKDHIAFWRGVEITQ